MPTTGAEKNNKRCREVTKSQDISRSTRRNCPRSSSQLTQRPSHLLPLLPFLETDVEGSDSSGRAGDGLPLCLAPLLGHLLGRLRSAVQQAELTGVHDSCEWFRTAPPRPSRLRPGGTAAGWLSSAVSLPHTFLFPFLRKSKQKVQLKPERDSSFGDRLFGAACYNAQWRSE